MSTITAILLLIFNHYSMFELNKLYSTSGICSYFRMHVYVPVVVGLCLRQDGKRGLMATFGMYVCMYVCDTHMWHMHRPPAAWVCSLDAHKWCYKRSQRHSTSFVNPTKWASWEHTHSAQACRSMCIDLYSLWQALGVCHWSSVQKFSIKQPPKTKCGTQTCPKVWPPCLYISEDVPSAAVGVSFVNTNSNRRLRIGLQIFCTAVHSNPPMPVVLIPAIPACSCRSTVPASPPVTMESFLVLSSSFWLSVLLGPLIW